MCWSRLRASDGGAPVKLEGGTSRSARRSAALNLGGEMGVVSGSLSSRRGGMCGGDCRGVLGGVDSGVGGRVSPASDEKADLLVWAGPSGVGSGWTHFLDES